VEIEYEGAASVVVVGEEHRAFGHGVFGVVNAESCLVGRESGEEMAVVRRRRIGVDDGEEVFALKSAIAGPSEEVVAGLGAWVGLWLWRGEGREDEANDDCYEWEETAHVSSRLMGFECGKDSRFGGCEMKCRGVGRVWMRIRSGTILRGRIGR
jgi:hypothetical protein